MITIAGGLESGESAPVPPVAVDDGRLLGRAGLSKALGVSLATVDRACLQGLPYELVGTRRRFDLVAVRAWFAARGKVATTPIARDPAVDAIARSAGLRVAK